MHFFQLGKMLTDRIESNKTYTTKRYLWIGLMGLSVSGCATGPLKTAEQRERIVEAIGFQSSGAALMYNCFFEEVQGLDSEKAIRGVRGIVAMTESEICLMDGAFPMAPTRHFIKIPLSEIEGVHGSSAQVQIKYQDRVYALIVFDWETFHPNYSLTQRVFRALITANVPEFRAERNYSWSMIRSSRGYGYSSSSNVRNMPSTNLEASVQAHHSKEKSLLERQNQPFK